MQFLLLRAYYVLGVLVDFRDIKNSHKVLIPKGLTVSMESQGKLGENMIV